MSYDILFIFQGAYRISYKAVLRCSNPTILNWYLSKKSANTTEVKGNFTLLFPLDDSLDVSFFYKFILYVEGSMNL